MSAHSRLLLPVGVEQCRLPVSSTISARHTGLSSLASMALAAAQRTEARAQQSPRIISIYISSPLGEYPDNVPTCGGASL